MVTVLPERQPHSPCCHYVILEQRQQAKNEKNWALSDKIRDDLAALGFEVKDTKDGVTWTLSL